MPILWVLEYADDAIALGANLGQRITSLGELRCRSRRL